MNWFLGRRVLFSWWWYNYLHMLEHFVSKQMKDLPYCFYCRMMHNSYLTIILLFFVWSILIVLQATNTLQNYKLLTTLSLKDLLRKRSRFWRDAWAILTLCKTTAQTLLGVLSTASILKAILRSSQRNEETHELFTEPSPDKSVRCDGNNMDCLSNRT